MENKMRSKTFIVAKFEIIRQLKKPSFWVALLLLPVLILGIIGISALSSSSANQTLTSTDAVKDKTIGLTDSAGIISENTLSPDSIKTILGENTKLEIIGTKDQGIEDVKSGKLDVYYYLPPDFISLKVAEFYTRKSETSIFSVSLENPLRAILSSSAYADTSVTDAIILTKDYTIESTTYNEKGEKVNLLGEAVIPFAILAIFYVLVCVFGNRMLMTVVEEKENRISEMILTSVSARHLIIGKIIAIILLGFLQILVFVIPSLIAVFIYRDNPAVAGILSIIEVNPPVIIMNVLLLIFSYFLFAGASTFVGAVVPTARDASQFIGPVIIGTVLPLFFLNSFFATTPDGIVYFLSYFPFSAPIALMIRNAFGTLEFWEFMIGIVEIAVCSIIVLHFTIKTFQKNAINFSIAKPKLISRK